MPHRCSIGLLSATNIYISSYSRHAQVYQDLSLIFLQSLLTYLALRQGAQFCGITEHVVERHFADDGRVGGVE